MRKIRSSKPRKRHRFPARTALLVALLCALPVKANLASSWHDTDLVLHITDAGIRQWDKAFVTGQNLARPPFAQQTPNRVRPAVRDSAYPAYRGWRICFEGAELVGRVRRQP